MGVGKLHKAIELEQIEGAVGIFPGREKGAGEAEGGQQPEKPCSADASQRFDGEKRAVGAGLLLHAAADHQRVTAVAASVAAVAERQAGDDPRGVVIL